MHDDNAYRDLMRAVFDNHRGEDRQQLSAQEYEKAREDFAFHMTDWTGDLRELSELLAHADSAKPDEATIKIIGILYHVLPHMTEAANLLLDGVPNPFAEERNSTENVSR